MASINASVAGVLITFTVLGVLFYLGIVIVGASSYECPFQTPVSVALRSTWKTAKPYVTTTSTSLLHLPILTTVHHLWEAIQCQVLHVLLCLPSITHWLHSHSLSLPVTQPTPQQPMPWLTSMYSLWENIQCRILCATLNLPQIQPLPTPITTPMATSPWLTPTALATLRSTNAGDLRCVSWILWNITDPEALDAALRLAGTVWWFEDGLDVEPPYDQIVSTFKGCFDSNGRIYAGSRDRAYHSAQAVLWIHICAMCVSGEFGERFPLPTIFHNATSLDLDLNYLLKIYASQDTPYMIYRMYFYNAEATPVCFQWTSNALLHLSWAKCNIPGTFNVLSQFNWYRGYDPIPLNAVLNNLLAFCIFIGRPVEWELLKIQDKRYAMLFPFSVLLLLTLLFASDQFDRILSQFSQAMVQAINTSHSLCVILPELLERLCNSKSQSKQLTEMAYEWCSVICENYSTLEDAKDLLLLSLETGFRYIDPTESWIEAQLIHTVHYEKLVNVVFSSGDGEAIADLLCAWTSWSSSHVPYPQLKICTEYLIGLHHLYPFSSRLQLYTICAVGFVEYQCHRAIFRRLFLHSFFSFFVRALSIALIVVSAISLLSMFPHCYRLMTLTTS